MLINKILRVLSVLMTRLIDFLQQGWCDIPGTADEVRAKLKLRQEGAIKRERANAYSLSQQVFLLYIIS